MVFQRADIRDVINTIAIHPTQTIVVAEVQGEVSMRLEKRAVERSAEHRRQDA